MKNSLAKSIRGSALSMVLPLFIMAEVHASAEDVHQIIDICTSSERIMKDYALIGMKITYHDPKKDLDATVAKLDKEMEELEKHKLTKTLHDEEIALHHEWAKIEENLTHDPVQASALTLHHHVNTFAKHCEVLAEHLAQDTGSPAEHYVVLIARLNLNVQELAGIYTMKAWGSIADEEYYGEVHEILEDYSKTYNELISAKDEMVSASVKSKLKMLKKHFMVFEFMADSKSGRFVPLLIAKKANGIHEETTTILKQEESEVEK